MWFCTTRPVTSVRRISPLPDFPEQFKGYRGYDPRPFLPALNGAVIENREITDRFLYDFRKTLGELLVDAYYREASASARRVGLGVEAEAGGPGPPVHQVPVDALAALGAIDAMRGEFWPFRPGLEIEVANTWANRIVGDTGLPEEQRRTRTNITGTGTPRVQWADLPLRDSGLFGPVRLIRDAGVNTD
jgi:hypothetical protein